VDGLPEGTILGPIEMVEVYETYDAPVLFACRSRLVDARYLALWVDRDDREDTWLYLPATARRFAEIRSGGIALADAFRNSESGLVVSVRVVRASGAATASTVNAAEVPDSDLPSPSVRLALPTATESSAVPPIAEFSREARTHGMDLTFDLRGARRTEAPAAVIGNILRAVQSLADSVGQAMQGLATERGPVPESVLSRTRLSVCTVFGGSFGVRFRTAADLDMFPDPFPGEVLCRIVSILGSADDQTKLLQYLVPLRIRAITSYRRLLQFLQAAESGVTAVVAGPEGDVLLRGRLDRGSATSALRVVSDFENREPVVHDVVCILVGMHVYTKRFVVETTEDPAVTYSGLMSASVLEAEPKPRLNATYRATIAESEDFNGVTGESRMQYTLLSLSAL